MNKNLMKLLGPFLFLTFSASNAMTQDFTATGPTDNVASNIVYPLKAGASIQLQVKLKSNRKDTCTVSIDKNALGYIAVGGLNCWGVNRQRRYHSLNRN